MIQEERKRYILEMLNDKESVTVQEIVKKCNVSEITVRRDLEALALKNLIIRTHGGAIKTQTIDHLFNYDLRIQRNKEEKIAICRKASEYIQENDIIFIDCGTTLIHLAQFITRLNNITVITNSLPVVSELINFTKINLILIGGNVISERKAIYGPAAELFIAMHHANKAFIGADGVSLHKGLSSYDANEAAITSKMTENADHVFLICDSSKIEKNSFVTITPISKINYLITNRGISQTIIKKFKKTGINFITV